MKAKNLIPLFFSLFIIITLIYPVLGAYESTTFPARGVSSRNPYLLSYWNGSRYVSTLAYAYWESNGVVGYDTRNLIIRFYTPKGELISTVTIPNLYISSYLAWYDWITIEGMNKEWVMLLQVYPRNAVNYPIHVVLYRVFPKNGTYSALATLTANTNFNTANYRNPQIAVSSVEAIYYAGKMWIAYIANCWQSGGYNGVVFGIFGVGQDGSVTSMITAVQATDVYAPYTLMLTSNSQNPDVLLWFEISGSTLRYHRYTISTNTFSRNVYTTTLKIDNVNFDDGIIAREIFWYDSTNKKIVSYAMPYRISGYSTGDTYMLFSYRFTYANTKIASGALYLFIYIAKSTLTFNKYDTFWSYKLDKVSYPADNRPANWGNTSDIWYSSHANCLFLVMGAANKYEQTVWDTEDVPLSQSFYAVGFQNLVDVGTNYIKIYFYKEKPPDPYFVPSPTNQTIPHSPTEPNYPTQAIPFFITGFVIPMAFILAPTALLAYCLGQVGAFLGLIIGLIISVVVGLLPTWTILIVGLALAYLLLKGRIGGGADNNE